MALLYAEIEYWLSVAILATAMCGMGASLTPRSLLDVARSPRGIMLTIALQIGLAPILALTLAWLVDADPGIRMGMLLIAALPGGLFSNILTYLGRGNLALSVAATTAGPLGCLATTSAVLRWWGGTWMPADVSLPTGRILFEISCCMLLPLILGGCLRRYAPQRGVSVAKALVNTSFVLLLLMVAAATMSGRVQFFSRGLLTPATLFFFAVALIWISYIAGWLCGMSLRDSFTIAVEVVVRNAHLGLVLKAALFPAADRDLNGWGDGVLYVVLVYGGLSMAVAGCETFMRRAGVGLIYGRNGPLGRLYHRSPWSWIVPSGTTAQVDAD